MEMLLLTGLCIITAIIIDRQRTVMRKQLRVRVTPKTPHKR